MKEEKERVLSRSHLESYMGWSPSAIGLLPQDPSKWTMELVLATERKKAFKEIHAAPLCISETALKKNYFFTDGIIRRFNIQPDHLATNPHHRSGPKIKLHRLGKIALLRQQENLAAELESVAEKRVARSDQAKAQHAARADAWITDFKGVAGKIKLSSSVSLKEIDAEILARHGASDPNGGHIARWRVNILRHDYSPYDAVLVNAMPPGSAGRRCYQILKEHILGLIAARFPELANECARQVDEVRFRDNLAQAMK